MDGTAFSTTDSSLDLSHLHLQVLACDNGVGLGRDMHLISEVLEAAGACVTMTRFPHGHARARARAASLRLKRSAGWVRGHLPAIRFDANLMAEHVRPSWLGLARCNLLIPNPEWFTPRKARWLPRIDGVLCKTRHAQRIFDELGSATWRTGFTSRDRLQADVPRQRAFFHLAGRSRTKGTQRLLALWQNHPEWPRLTVVQHPDFAATEATANNIRHIVGYLDDAELCYLQNAHRFHLCPSETEGYGHYLGEALSAGAVTLTVDAPPMNELVGPDRGVLVDARRSGQQGFADTFAFDVEAMQAAIERLLAMGDAHLAVLGANARRWYEDNDRQFRQHLVRAVRVFCEATQGVAESRETPAAAKASR